MLAHPVKAASGQKHKHPDKNSDDGSRHFVPNDAAPHLPPLTQWISLPTLQEKSTVHQIKLNLSMIGKQCIHPVA